VHSHFWEFGVARCSISLEQGLGVILNPLKMSQKNKTTLMDFHWETKYVKGVMTKRKV